MECEFFVYLRTNDFKLLVDEEDNIKYSLKRFTLQAALDLIDIAFKTKKSRYGFEVYINNKDANESVFFRFGNITTRERDSGSEFIKKNWYIS